MQRVLRARAIVEGEVEADLVVLRRPISLLGELDPKNGVISTGWEKISVKDKVLAIPSVRGSTVGSYVLYAAKENGCAPKGIVALKPDPILITGAVISDIPLLQPIDDISLEELAKYRRATLSSREGIIRLFG